MIRFVGLLSAVVVLILLLACLNVAHLLMSNGAEREQQLGVLVALGASRSRLMKELLTENLLLGLSGGLAGLALGAIIMRVLTAFSLPGGIPIGSLTLSLDRRVLIFSIAISLVTSLLFGLLPAWRASRTDPVRAFRSGRVTGSARGKHFGLLAGQVAISLVLLIAAALFLRSLRAGLEADLGFDPDRISAVTVELRLHSFSYAEARDYYSRVVGRVEATPGVSVSAVAAHVPLAPTFAAGLKPAGSTESQPGIELSRNFVTPGYFKVMQIPLLAGRDFGRQDRPGSPLVAILSESAARALWPGEQAVGRRVSDLTDRTFEIIGVVGDIQYESLSRHERGVFYYPMLKHPVVGKVSVLARHDGFADWTSAMTGAVHETDPRVAVVNPRRLSDQVDAVLMPQRFGSVLLACFGALAMVIALVGIYATLARSVARRRNELSIRIALGARRVQVLRLVLLRTATTIGSGVAAGLAASVVAAQSFGRFLYGIPELDLTSFALATVALGVAVVLVALFPARRAMRTNPVHLIRTD